VGMALQYLSMWARHFNIYLSGHGTSIFIYVGTALQYLSIWAWHFNIYLCGHGTSIFIYLGTALQYLSIWARHFNIYTMNQFFSCSEKKNQFSNEMYIK
jgi:hypothetical protein